MKNYYLIRTPKFTICVQDKNLLEEIKTAMKKAKIGIGVYVINEEERKDRRYAIFSSSAQFLRMYPRYAQYFEIKNELNGTI